MVVLKGSHKESTKNKSPVEIPERNLEKTLAKTTGRVQAGIPGEIL